MGRYHPSPFNRFDYVNQDRAPSGYTFSFTSPDADLFETDGINLFVKAGVTFAFETRATASATLVVRDATLDPSTTITHDFSLSVEKGPLLGNAAADVLTGTTSIDQIFGSSGNDKIEGLDGNDDLTGGAGNNTFLAGAGNDVIH